MHVGSHGLKRIVFICTTCWKSFKCFSTVSIRTACTQSSIKLRTLDCLFTLFVSHSLCLVRFGQLSRYADKRVVNDYNESVH